MTKKYLQGNREYKSDVFSMMLRIPEYALDVYNAMNGSDYTNAELIEIILLENGISLSIRNDASFFISNYLNLYEHQSTYSPNAPLRFLIYLTNLMKDIVEKRDLYSRKRVKIATPHFAVFYNGTEPRPEREVLKLSDAFINPTDSPEVELICTIYNINPDNNKSLLAKSKVLNGYMSFVNRVRDNLSTQRTTEKNVDLEDAIREAIDYCIANHVMEDFFRENKDEVMKSMLLDYTWERREELIRAEEYEDGLAEGEKRGIVLGEKRGIALGEKRGVERGRFQVLAKLVQDGILTIQKAAEEAGMSISEFENKLVNL